MQVPPVEGEEAEAIRWWRWRGSSAAALAHTHTTSSPSTIERKLTQREVETTGRAAVASGHNSAAITTAQGAQRNEASTTYSTSTSATAAQAAEHFRCQVGGRIGANKTLPTSGSSRTAVAAPTPPATVVLVRAGGVCGQGSLLGSMRALQLLVIYSSTLLQCCDRSDPAGDRARNMCT